MIFRAPYAMSNRGELIADAAVRVDGTRIVEVGTRREIAGPVNHDLDGCLLMPGLVNAHTHLELGYAARRCPPTPDFTQWLRAIIRERGSLDSGCNTVADAVRAGLRESLAAGVTLIGDIARHPGPVRAAIAATASRPAVVSFGEVIAIGRGRHLADESIAAAVDMAAAGPTLAIGISPHAPYSVEPDVFRTCSAIADDRCLPLAVHAAETQAEREWTLQQTGPFRDFLADLQVWDSGIKATRRKPIELLQECQILSPRSLLAHVNYVDDDEIAILAASGASVAWCPRTHAAFGHDPHPFRKLRDAGINICLGTDSLASNPSLSMLEEIRFVRRAHPDVAATELMLMATAAGAMALGQAGVTGRLHAGLRADLIAIPLVSSGPRHPLENVLASNKQPQACWVAGIQVWQA
jgi:cytosine/adenosine deaminase-related metal-dependent hydrolase